MLPVVDDVKMDHITKVVSRRRSKDGVFGESVKERVEEPSEVEEEVEVKVLEEVVAGFRINAGDQGESRDLREEVKLQLLPASAPGMRKRICLIATQTWWRCAGGSYLRRGETSFRGSSQREASFAKLPRLEPDAAG